MEPRVEKVIFYYEYRQDGDYKEGNDVMSPKYADEHLEKLMKDEHHLGIKNIDVHIVTGTFRPRFPRELSSLKSVLAGIGEEKREKNDLLAQRQTLSEELQKLDEQIANLCDCTKCPRCGSALEENNDVESPVPGEITYDCTNDDCEASLYYNHELGQLEDV